MDGLREVDWGRMENESLTDYMDDLIERHHRHRVRRLALEAVAVAAQEYLIFPDRAFPEVKDALEDALAKLKMTELVTAPSRSPVSN